jgi:hypothetical protein
MRPYKFGRSSHTKIPDLIERGWDGIIGTLGRVL